MAWFGGGRASGEIGRMTVGVEADIHNLTSGLNTAQNQIGAFAGRASSLAGFVATTLSTAIGFTLAAAFQQVSGAMGMGIASGWQYLDMMESNTIAFKTLTGSVEETQSRMDEMWEFAKRTPFTFPDVTTAAKKFEAFGFAAEDVLPMLTAVGDATAAFGATPEVMQRITIALGQIKAKNRVMAEEMLQLTEANIPAWQYLADAMGMSTAEVMKLSEKGLIPADFAIKALVTGMEKAFPGMMEEQAKSYSGLMSTLRDTTSSLFGGVLKPLFVALVSSWLPKAVAKTSEWADAMKDLGTIAGLKVMNEDLGHIIEALVKIAKEVGPVFGLAWKAVTKVLAEVMEAVRATLELFAGEWRDTWSWARAHPLFAAAGVVFLISVINKLIWSLKQLQKAQAVTMLFQSGALMARFGSITAGAALVSEGFTLAETATLGWGAALGGLIAKLGLANVTAADLIATLGNPMLLSYLIAGALPSEPMEIATGTYATPKQTRKQAEANLAVNWAEIMMDEAKAAGKAMPTANDVAKQISANYTWEQSPLVIAPKAVSAYAKQAGIDLKVMKESLTGDPKMDAWFEKTEAYLKKLQESWKASGEAAKTTSDRQVEALTKLKAVSDAEAALAAARKGGAPGAIALAEAQLAQAREDATTATRDYAMATAQSAIAHKYGGKMAAWAADVAVKGAGAVAAAQANVISAINGQVGAWNAVGYAAINAANAAIEAGKVMSIAQLQRVSLEAAWANPTAPLPTNEQLAGIANYTKQMAALNELMARYKSALKNLPKLSFTPAGGGGGGGGGGGAAGPSAADAMKERLDAARTALDDFIKELKSKAKQVAATWGLFDRPTRRAVTVSRATKNLTKQVKVLTQWHKDLTKLRTIYKKYPGFLQYLYDLGPDAAAFIHKLAMAPKAKQLDLANLFNKKEAVAGEELIEENRAKLQSLAAAVAKALGANKAKATAIGKSIVTGLIAGVKSQSGWMLKQLDSWCNLIVKRIKAKLKIKSPSAVFASLGQQIVAGLAEGIASSAGLVDKALSGAIPRGVDFAGSPALAGAVSYGDVNVILQGTVVRNDVDIDRMANRIATVIDQRRRASGVR